MTQFPEIEWRRIRAMRSVLAHEYFGVSLDIVWETVVEDLPGLRTRLGRVLNG